MEIGIAVGSAFLSSALNVLFERLAPQGELLKMFMRKKHDFHLLEKLRRTLCGFRAVLSDAENKQASNPDVTQWLNELRDAVDSAENLMEEINYEVLRVKAEGQHQNHAEASKQQVSDLNLCLGDGFFRNIKKKLEGTTKTLEELEKQIGRLGLKDYLVYGKQETRVPSTSLVDESDIFGRQTEIETLVERLLSVDKNGKSLRVIAIVGMPGVGKTTLAKVVYNDENVKDYFDLKAWFCVSEPYDAFRITKGLLQEIGSFDLKDDNNLNQLQVKLKESLKRKKFLIVLDDVWNDNYSAWDDLKNLFVQGDAGSTIIVTTRKKSVAMTMGNEQISMDTLSIDVSWSLFKRHAFDNMDPKEHLEHVEVGKQIAAKCKGLPLALKTLAGLLRSKSEIEEWRCILRSEIWELPDNGILPALMLSYNDLPLHLKQCFSYCAIFPKDYPFDKEQVIQLWIANGLVQWLQKDKIIEDLGNQYFLELRSRSLFERVSMYSQGNTDKFLMHDLVNDLAQVTSSKLCINLEDNKGSDMLGRCRHLSYSRGYSGDFEKLKPLYKLEQMRTLLPININRCWGFPLSKRVLHNILPRLTSLRALSLSRYHFNELPNVLFIELKLLRFLDLSWTKIKQLPDSICVLYNLETLLLSYCMFLEELPQQMEKLINLRHLNISGTSRLKMPLHLSKLKSICVAVVEHIEKLSLEWTADNSLNERDILGELHANPNVKELKITGYRGTNFPNWLADHPFSELVKLSISNCKDCYSLPALGQLPSLKFLAIRGMHRITEVAEEFYGSSSSKKPFNSLERLEFDEMLEWKHWHVLGNGEFPTLQDLSIDNCPELIGKLPENLCSLTSLTISNCPELNLETPIQLSSLKRFTVECSPKVGVLFDDAELFLSQLQGMKQIVQLCFSYCHSLTSLPFSSMPNTLKEIEIKHCGKLKLESPVGDMISGGSNMFLEKLELVGCDSINEISPELVPQAHYLTIKSCNSLTRLLIPNGTEELIINDHLFGKCENLEILSVAQTTSLLTLNISNCEKLKSLPEHMKELLPTLKKLFLNDCPEIESFPEGGLPFNLEVLKIMNCKKLVNGRKEWGLQRLPCLTELTIFHDGSDEEIPAGDNWELPSSIQTLSIYSLKTLSSQVFKILTSLEYLSTFNLPQIQSMLEEGLPSSLLKLTLDSHDELHSLPTEGLRRLTSLQRLQITSCNQLKSIPESGLPSSLSELTISSCHNLQSLQVKRKPSFLSLLPICGCGNNLQPLPESALPSSLSKLEIRYCPKLKSLPVKGMPSSISEISISRCPLLQPSLEFEKGDYWTNIAQIPTIEVDGEYL